MLARVGFPLIRKSHPAIYRRRKPQKTSSEHSLYKTAKAILRSIAEENRKSHPASNRCMKPQKPSSDLSLLTQNKTQKPSSEESLYKTAKAIQRSIAANTKQNAKAIQRILAAAILQRPIAEKTSRRPHCRSAKIRCDHGTHQRGFAAHETHQRGFAAHGTHQRGFADRGLIRHTRACSWLNFVLV